MRRLVSIRFGYDVDGVYIEYKLISFGASKHLIQDSDWAEIGSRNSFDRVQKGRDRV